MNTDANNTNTTDISTDTPEVDTTIAEPASDVLDKEGGRLAAMLERRAGEILANPGGFISLQGSGGTTLLHLAAAAGDEEVVAALLKAGMQPDVRSDRGVTPLMVAAAIQNDNIIGMLEASGADINAENSFGVSPSGYYALGGLRSPRKDRLR